MHARDPPLARAERPAGMLRHMVVRPLPALLLVTILSACGSETDATSASDDRPSPVYEWRQDCGVTYYKHLPHNPGEANDPSYEAEEYVGLSLDEARDRAERAGLEVRILGIDGECADRTDDLRHQRVNFYVEEGEVARAARY